MLAGAAESFDPNLFVLDADLDLVDAPAPVSLITQWRSVASEIGRRLARADTEATRRAVVAEIERNAAAGAAVLRAAAAVDGSQEIAGEIAAGGAGVRFLTPAERDACCEATAGDAAP